MTDGVTTAIALGAMNIVALIVSGVIRYYEHKATNSKMEEIHVLVNSNFGNQLSISAKALRRIADMSCDEKDNLIATEAERLLAQHLAKQ